MHGHFIALPQCLQKRASRSFGLLHDSQVAISGCSAPSESAASAADAPSAPPAEEVAPHEMTCGEVRDALDDEEREEEASYLVVWAYGVRTGVKGLDFEKHPVTKAGLEDFITRVTLTCKVDLDKRFVDAILE